MTDLPVWVRCSDCPTVTPALVHACASVGMEHQRSTADVLAAYLAAKHDEHERGVAA